MPVKSIRSSVVRDRVQVVKWRGTCNGRREHCTDIVRARPVARCSLEKRIKNVHAIMYVTFQERVAGGGNLSKQVFHVGHSIKDGSMLSEDTNLWHRVANARANLTDRKEIVSHRRYKQSLNVEVAQDTRAFRLNGLSERSTDANTINSFN